MKQDDVRGKDENGDYSWVKWLKESLAIETTGTMEWIKAVGNFRILVGNVRTIEMAAYEQGKKEVSTSLLQKMEQVIGEDDKNENIANDKEMQSWHDTRVFQRNKLRAELRKKLEKMKGTI